MKKRHIIAIDLILLAGTLFAVAGLVYTLNYSKPVLLSPSDGLVTTNSRVLFEFKNAETILIDDNLEFTSPQRINVKDGLVISLKPGHYYWKVEGVIDSEVREFTILSEVNLKLIDKGDGRYEVVNAGNIELDVEVYQYGKFKERVVLDLDESKEISGTEFVGKEGGE